MGKSIPTNRKPIAVHAVMALMVDPGVLKCQTHIYTAPKSRANQRCHPEALTVTDYIDDTVEPSCIYFDVT